MHPAGAVHLREHPALATDVALAALTAPATLAAAAAALAAAPAALRALKMRVELLLRAQRRGGDGQDGI